MAGQYWVTWPDIPDHNQARQRALIWGPQAKPPPAVTSPVRMFQGGPFAARADAVKYRDAIGSANPLPPGGTPIVGSSGRGLTQTIANANPLTGLQAIGKFFAALGQASVWIRLAEGLLGLGLIAVGLAKITNTDVALKKAAMSAAKVAAL